MPPKAARCYEKWDGLGPWVWKTDPGRPCEGCRWLYDRELFDPKTERPAHRAHKCVWAPPEAGVEWLQGPKWRAAGETWTPQAKLWRECTVAGLHSQRFGR
eukprot:COSAG04_NODE_4351_length_2142_cov_0.938326_3_plen_100_part_01